MKPTLGRIVHFREPTVTAQWRVALVIQENPLVLRVFNPGADFDGDYNITPRHPAEGTDPGQWCWPPRV